MTMARSLLHPVERQAHGRESSSYQQIRASGQFCEVHHRSNASNQYGECDGNDSQDDQQPARDVDSSFLMK